MENKSKFPEYTFNHAKARFEQMSPTRFSYGNFVEKAYISWRDLPDRHVRDHVYIGKVDMNNRIELPDNVDYIKAVTTPSFVFDLYVDRFDRLTMYYNGSKPYNTVKDKFPWESNNFSASIKDKYGKLLTFVLVDDGVIEFEQEDLKGLEVAILYSGILVDDNCDPLLTNNEINAIAYSVAYMDTLYGASSGDPNKAKMLGYMENKMLTAMAKAGIPERVTDNDMDRLLNAKVSMNRKYYNRNYKFRR